LETSGEIGGRGARGEVAVGIVTGRQLNDVRPDTGALQALRQLVGSLLAAAVAVSIKGQIDGSGSVADLLKLAGIEMGSQRAGQVAKPGLPSTA
jgi:hypothetical protein